jgi:hypothetical protein
MPVVDYIEYLINDLEGLDMKHNLSYIALFLGVFAAGCSADALIDPSVRPDLPAATALHLDFSFFQDNVPAEESEHAAWTQAVAEVADAAVAMEDMIIPQALVMAAAAGQGSFDDDVWTWSFSTTIAGDAYSGELRANVIGNQHEWDLVVTSPDHSPALTDYLWAKAFTPSSGFDGEWYIADAGNASGEVVARSSWLANSSGSVDLSFSNSESTSWTYQRLPSEHVLTRFLLSSPQAQIRWNPADGSGDAWTPDAGMVCWDTNQVDVAC